MWREVLAGRNWRNTPIALLLTLLVGANLLHHIEEFRPELAGSAVRLALGVAAVLMALIGGRITPSFTRNWLVRQGENRLPASFGRLDGAALVASVAGMAAWNAAPEHMISGTLLIAAGILLLARLARWRGWRARGEPIVLILHLGYLWLSAAFLLLGWSIVDPIAMPHSAALHALTAGAVATMTLAVMTRASRGHTGRAIETDAATLLIYAFVTAGALLRVAASPIPGLHPVLLLSGGVVWSLAFGLFALSYGPMLLTRNSGS